MTTLLEIRTSVHSENGESSKLTARFVEHWRARHPEGKVVVRDLARAPLPHITGERFGAFITPAEKRTPAQAAHVAESDALIAELKAADAIALGLPMYNFGIPSTLKSWFDNVARAGVTFRYTPGGSIGLVGDKPLYVFAARGGKYEGTGRDFQTGHVRQFFTLLGIKEIRFVYAEGLAIDPETKARALETAHAEIDSL